MSVRSPSRQCSGEKLGIPNSLTFIASIDAIDQYFGASPVLPAFTDASAPALVAPIVLNAANSPSGVEVWHPMHVTLLPPGLTATSAGVSAVTTDSSPTEKPLSSPLWSMLSVRQYTMAPEAGAGAIRTSPLVPRPGGLESLSPTSSAPRIVTWMGTST